MLRLRSLVGGLLILGLLTACTPDPPDVPADTWSMLGTFPESTQSISQVDLQQLKTEAGISFFGARGIQLTLLDSDMTFDPLTREQRAELNAFIEASGFDPDTDLNAVLIGATPLLDDTDPEALERPLAVFSATFTRDALAEALLDASDLIRPVDEATHRFAFDRAEDADLEDSSTHIALLDDNRIAVGHANDIDALLARHDEGRDGLSVDATTRGLIGYAAQGGSAWSVLLDMPREIEQTVDEIDDADDAEEWQRRLARVAQVTDQGGLAFTLDQQNVQSRLTLVAHDNARDVRRLLNGVLSGAQSQDRWTEDQQAMLENIEIRDEGAFVHIDMSTTQRFLAELALNASS